MTHHTPYTKVTFIKWTPHPSPSHFIKSAIKFFYHSNSSLSFSLSLSSSLTLSPQQPFFFSCNTSFFWQHHTFFLKTFPEKRFILLLSFLSSIVLFFNLCNFQLFRVFLVVNSIFLGFQTSFFNFFLQLILAFLCSTFTCLINC